MKGRETRAGRCGYDGIEESRRKQKRARLDIEVKGGAVDLAH